MALNNGDNARDVYSENAVQEMLHRWLTTGRQTSPDDAAPKVRVTGVLSGGLEPETDEIAVFGGIDGSETANAATRQIINVSSAGRLRQGAGVIVSTANSRSTTLSASATFTGTGEDISDYAQINLKLYGTPSTAKASLYFEFSDDGTNWDTSVPILVRNPSLFIPYPLINVGKYYRVRYLNDGGAQAISDLGLSEAAGTPTNQTAFRLTSYLYGAATKELARTLDQGVTGSDPVSLGRNVIMGAVPAGTYTNLRANGQDTNNSTTTTLGSGATYTGTVADVRGYVSGFIEINSNVVSATDGIIVQFSDTQAFTSVRSEVQTFSYATINLSKGVVFPFTVTDSYMRIKYTNGGTAQGSFYLATFLHTQPVEQPREAIESTLDSGDLAVLGRSVVVAKNDAGTYGNILRGPNGGLRVHGDSLRSIKATQQTIGATAAQVTASALTSRRTIVLKNQSSGANDQIFIGQNSAVTTGSGYLLVKNEPIVIELDDTATIYAIADGVSRTLGILEIAE